MSPRPSAVRIGLFAIGGMALLIAAVALLVGGRLFADTERALLKFKGSVQGLQVGAPVVMRGVRLGNVQSIHLVGEGGGFAVPVVVELDLSLIRGPVSGADKSLSIATLVQRGLTARLASQSLLTGQQYVDLDLRGAPRQGVAQGSTAQGRTLPQIPTEAPPLQALQEQLGKIDIAGLIDEARSTLTAVRGLVGGPEIRSTLADLATASASLARLSDTLKQRAPRLADRAETALVNAGAAALTVDSAAGRIGGAAGQLGTAAERIGGAAGRADALLAPDSPTLVSLRKAADELAGSAAALRQSSSGDSPTVQQLQQSLADVGRAARAVRQLAELLDQQPEALLRGRAETK